MNAEVTFDVVKGRVCSSAVHDSAARAFEPVRLVAAIECALVLARRAHGTWAPRAEAIRALSWSPPGFPYTVIPGTHGRMLYVGCHEFKTADVRTMRDAIKQRFPDLWKVARHCALCHMFKALPSLPDRRKAAA